MDILLYRDRDYSWTIKRGTTFGDDIRITLSQSGRNLAQMSCDENTGRFSTNADDLLKPFAGEASDLVRLTATAEKSGSAVELSSCRLHGDISFVVVEEGAIAFAASIVMAPASAKIAIGAANA